MSRWASFIRILEEPKKLSRLNAVFSISSTKEDFLIFKKPIGI
jgi:hypothetical protein